MRPVFLARWAGPDRYEGTRVGAGFLLVLRISVIRSWIWDEEEEEGGDGAETGLEKIHLVQRERIDSVVYR